MADRFERYNQYSSQTSNYATLGGKKRGERDNIFDRDYGDHAERNPSARESVAKIIMDEIKSIHTDRKKPLPSYMMEERKKTTDQTYKEVEEYLKEKQKTNASFRMFSEFVSGCDVFFRNKQVMNEQVFQDFFQDLDLSNIQFYTHTRNYQDDRFDKLKVMKFYEDNVHKLRRTLETSMRDDLIKMKDYLTKKLDNVVAQTTTIFNEYLNIYQRKLNAEILKIVNDDKHNVYDFETRSYLEKVVRRESNDYLKYKHFFPDFIKLIDFLNMNQELKNQFIKKNFKFNTFDHVPLSSYLELLNKNIDHLVDFKDDAMKQFKINEVKKASSSQYLGRMSGKNTSNLAKDPPKSVLAQSTRFQSSNVDNPALLSSSKIIGSPGGCEELGPNPTYYENSLKELPAENEPMFDLGETTKLAEPYWKLNQIVVNKTLETSHSCKDTISDFYFMDKERYAVTFSGDKSIRVTNLITGDNRLAIPYVHREGISALFVMAKGVVISGSMEGEIKMFDPSIGQSKGIMVGHKDRIWKFLEMPGESLVSCSEDHCIKFWNTDLRNSFKTVISPQNKAIRCMLRFTESKFFFSSHRIWLYNVNRDEIEKTFAGHNGFVRSMVYDKKANRLITGGEDDTLRFWSVESCAMLKVIAVAETRCMEIWMDEYLITGHSSFEVKFWDLGLTRLICEKKTKIFVDQIRIAAGGKIIYPEYNNLVVLKNPGV